MFARERGYANDMLMLAARGINGGTPVGRSEEGRKDREEEAIGRAKRRRSAKEVAIYAGAPRSRFITVIMNAYDDAVDEDGDKNDDGNDMVVAVTLRSMARNMRDKPSNKSRSFR